MRGRCGRWLQLSPAAAGQGGRGVLRSRDRHSPLASQRSPFPFVHLLRSCRHDHHDHLLGHGPQRQKQLQVRREGGGAEGVRGGAVAPTRLRAWGPGRARRGLPGAAVRGGGGTRGRGGAGAGSRGRRPG